MKLECDAKWRLLGRAWLYVLAILLVSCCGVAPTTITQVPTIPSPLPGQAALHVIGVYQGALPELADKRSWWTQCKALSATQGGAVLPSATECHAFIHHVSEQRTVTVNVSDDSSPITLGLMAYEPVLWKINLGPGVVIQKVILAGYHQQQVTGIGDVQVDVYNAENSPCDRCVQKGRYFYSYVRVPLEMEVAAGTRARSFQGNYTGGIYQIFKGMQ